MRLFKRKQVTGTPCPRCSQLVNQDVELVCPMCGWDLRDAYQGPTHAPATIGGHDEHAGERST